MALQFAQLTSRQGKLSRKDFLIWGVILFVVKLNLDRFIALLLGRHWDITSYFTHVDYLGLSNLTPDDQLFFGVLLFTAIPFIYVGTLLCLKRLRDANIAPSAVLLFFLPFLNLVFFLILSAVPSNAIGLGEAKSTHRNYFPKSKFGTAVLAVSLTCIFSFLMFALFINILGDYGWSVFIGIPFFLGFTSVAIYGAAHPGMSQTEAVNVTSMSILVVNILILALAFEGIICVAMGLPILAVIGAIGAALSYSIVKSRSAKTLNLVLIPMLAVPSLGMLESEAATAPPMISVVTEIEIDATQQTIWNELVAFSQIAEPEEWLFKTGIAYPTHAEIHGKGVGAVRHCNFTTGSFIEPITVWDEPNRLAFSVLHQPAPMVEWSIYQSLEIPHLDGYFVSERGEFFLENLPNGHTLLRGTTWYHHDIWPGIYWRLWSDFILHRIHLRVLEHIRKQAEANEADALIPDAASPIF